MKRLCVIGLWLGLLAVPMEVFGQAVGTIVGTVRDPTRAVVPGVSIKVTAVETGLRRETTSNETGNYTVPALPPGNYSIEAEMQGFSKQLIKDVGLQVDQTARIDIVLEMGTPTEVVEVRGEAALLNTESPALGQVIDNKRVLELPLNGRQFLELSLQVPGVVTGNGGPQSGDSSLFTRPGQNSSISVSGGRSQNNSYLLDGTQNTDPDVNAYVVSPSVDSVQEFKMETRNYSAELGRSSGGQINVVTKSGTNQFHGSVYEFLRNDAFDARPFNNPGELPEFRRNQFGGTLGGPILRDKTFFFASYEGLRRVEGQSRSLTVPSVVQKNGDFSGTAGIYDFITTSVDPTDPSGKKRIRSQFPGQHHPLDAFGSGCDQNIERLRARSQHARNGKQLSRYAFRTAAQQPGIFAHRPSLLTKGHALRTLYTVERKQLPADGISRLRHVLLRPSSEFHAVRNARIRPLVGE